MHFGIRKLDLTETPPYELLLMADPSIEQIENYLPLSEVFIAENEGEILGCYVICEIGKNQWEIKNIAVLTEKQGFGIGRKLIEDAIVRVRGRNALKIIIRTGNSSMMQLRLYQKCGFMISEVEKDYFVKPYPEPIFENGIQCKDRVTLMKVLKHEC
ncbi:MAG TPA: GNAT family N-acetyltransferase [Salinimicrobium sp.]|nr:GNAT family N-acetyltransferase [Salinimicrobium sp.]